METATAISGLHFFGLARASVLQCQQLPDFIFFLSVTSLEIMLSFQVRVIGLEGDKLEEINFKIFYVNTLQTIKDNRELGRVSDFLPNFLCIKIPREKMSADFLGGISLDHL